MDELAHNYAHWGLAGLFGFCLFVIVLVVLRYVVPEMLRAFRAELQAEREENARQLQAERDANDKHITLLVTEIRGVKEDLGELKGLVRGQRWAARPGEDLQGR